MQMYKNKYHYNDSPAADGRIKHGHNHDRVDERKTKERRKNDVENGVDKGKKLCPIFGTLSHFRYIKSERSPAAEILLFSGVLAVLSDRAAGVICDSFLSL